MIDLSQLTEEQINELDFQDFVRFKLCIVDYDYVSADEVSK